VFRILFILFVIVPIIEIMVLMQVGALLGAWPTLAIVVITAWLGAKNVKQQGIATLQSVQLKMAQGEMPSDDIVAGMLLLVAGVLLVTPGFVTDIFGLSLLIPQVRMSIKRAVQKYLSSANRSTHYRAGGDPNVFTQHNNQHNNQHNTFASSSDDFQPQQRQGKTLDGEFERKE
jgi:UPF0716 protein FxsA